MNACAWMLVYECLYVYGVLYTPARKWVYMCMYVCACSHEAPIRVIKGSLKVLRACACQLKEIIYISTHNNARTRMHALERSIMVYIYGQT